MASRPTSVKHTYEYPTDKQLSFARNLAIQAGYPPAYPVQAARRDMNGKNRIGDMKRQECSELISFLQAKLGK